MTEADRCVLFVYAHPDDEVFSPGGTIALLSDRGVRVVLALATAGEEGEVVNPELRDVVNPADLPAIRQDELLCSQRTLGIAEVVQLGYRDSGMAGSTAGERSDAFIQADREEAARRVAELIRDVKPQVVCTFDPTGGYGHPDHIMVNAVTRAAFERAGDAQWYPDAGEPWQPSKLYYPVFAQESVRQARAAMEKRGGQFEFGPRPVADAEPDVLGAPDEAITTVVDISTTLDRKIAAFRCYDTQNTPQLFYYTMPGDALREAFSREYFTLARSLVDTPKPEHDLFAGL